MIFCFPKVGCDVTHYQLRASRDGEQVPSFANNYMLETSKKHTKNIEDNSSFASREVSFSYVFIPIF